MPEITQIIPRESQISIGAREAQEMKEDIVRKMAAGMPEAEAAVTLLMPVVMMGEMGNTPTGKEVNAVRRAGASLLALAAKLDDDLATEANPQ